MSDYMYNRIKEAAQGLAHDMAENMIHDMAQNMVKIIVKIEKASEPVYGTN